jgi:undecaprenyl-diphosphatase
MLSPEVIDAILLGIVEGLTEFIPVSSTGHLILLVDMLKLNTPPGKVFEIVIQLGAILAICLVYVKKLSNIVLTMHNDKASQAFVRNIVIAFLPAALIGVMAHGFIKSVLFSPWVVSVSLIVGGIIILLIERRDITPTVMSTEGLSPKLSLAIGFFQTLAMVPGVSRSGATIMGALVLGVERKAATEFSFFLAIPTMLGAAVYDLYKNYDILSAEDSSIIAIGFVSAFIAALFVVRAVIAFVSTHGFSAFAWYRIALGVVMLGFLSF